MPISHKLIVKSEGNTTWEQLRATIHCFRQRFSTWPTNILIAAPLLAEVEKQLGPEQLAALRDRFHLITPLKASRVLVYDDLFRFCELGNCADGDVSEVDRWLRL